MSYASRRKNELIMQRKVIPLILLVVITGLCAWSPWITRDIASDLAQSQFDKAWSGVIDGCGTHGNDLGAKGFRKIPFGAYGTIDYQCGLVMPDEPALHTNVFVSFFGIAFGFPTP